MAGSNFRVVIVGGSISGLSLALMLEKNGIDFVVLEAYPTIAPQLGASIALLPNGFRIVDQLGCYEDILKCGQYPVDDFLIHDGNGKLLVGARNLRHEAVERHGYPVLFFERRQLVQILYDHIKNKDKVLTSKRVKSVEENDEGVTVTTEDGSVFKGDVAVGADGMHSALRGEIERKSSKPIDLRTDTLPADYGGVFGISEGDLKSPKGSVIIGTRKNSSLFVASGPDNRTYWCIFFKLDKRYYGNDTPCHGEEAEEYFSKKFWDHPITEDYKYSDLRKAALTSVCTPLHEYIIENWHSNRCIIIGDSVHKVNPIAGQGGNAALETSAALTNALVKLLKSNSSGKIPKEKLGAMFEEIQELRKPRTTWLCNESTKMQEVYAEVTPFFMVMNRYVLPLMGENAMLKNLSKAYPPAVSVDTLEIPSRPRSAPYFDERIREPKPRSTLFTLLVSTMLIGLGGLGAYLLPVLSDINGTFRIVESAVTTSFLAEMNVSLQSFVDAARFPQLDKLVKTLIAVFLPVVTGTPNIEMKIQAAYFLLGFWVPIFSIMAIEGYRWHNKGTLLWSPSFWIALAQVLGFGVVFPFYILTVFVISRDPAYWMACSQATPAHNIKAFAPSALILVYILPTVAMFTLDAHSPYLQPAIAFWQGTAILAMAATALLSRTRFFPAPPTHQPPTLASKPPPFLAAGPYHAPADLRLVRRLHAHTAIFSAAVHVATVAFYLFHPRGRQLDLLATFFPTTHVATVEQLHAPVATVADGMRLFFQLDLLLMLVGVALWSGLTLYDLRRVGMAHTGAVVKRGLLVLGGWVVLGPGAATALLWRWREEVVGGFVPRRMKVGEEEGVAGAVDVKGRDRSGSGRSRWGMGKGRDE